jgi:hypothetical protein
MKRSIEMRSLKVLGLALLAFCATSVALASTAAADEFTAEAYPATITGNLEQGTQLTIGTTAGHTTCNVAKQHGTIPGPTTTLTMTATWENCQGAGFPSVVHMNGCDFLYHVNGGMLTTGWVDIICPAGQEITKTSQGPGGTMKCVLHIPPQVGIGPVTYTNIGAGPTREITVDINANNLIYSHTAGTGIGACANGGGVNGILRDKTLWTGEFEGGGAHLGLFLS